MGQKHLFSSGENRPPEKAEYSYLLSGFRKRCLSRSRYTVSLPGADHRDLLAVLSTRDSEALILPVRFVRVGSGKCKPFVPEILSRSSAVDHPRSGHRHSFARGGQKAVIGGWRQRWVWRAVALLPQWVQDLLRVRGTAQVELHRWRGCAATGKPHVE